MGPFPVSLDKKKGVLNVSDTKSHYTWYLPFLKKLEVPQLFINLLTQLERNHGNKVRIVQTDNGTEFKNNLLSNFSQKLGIK